jgi:hypothetical protein
MKIPPDRAMIASTIMLPVMEQCIQPSQDHNWMKSFGLYIA